MAFAAKDVKGAPRAERSGDAAGVFQADVAVVLALEEQRGASD